MKCFEFLYTFAIVHFSLSFLSSFFASLEKSTKIIYPDLKPYFIAFSVGFFFELVTIFILRKTSW